MNNNNRSPKVSVIIPCYNYANFLPEAVGSVIGQTYRDFEIIIVNDGSTDNTKEVAEELINRYPEISIKLINQENQGLPASRNNAIKAARGEYILPLDADDMITPDYLEKTVPVLDKHPEISISYTDWQIFGDITEAQRNHSIGREYSLDFLLDNNLMPCCSLFRKRAWEEVGGYKHMTGYADWEFWIALGEIGHKGKFLNERLVLYRKHGRTMIDNSEEKHEELLSQIRKLHQKLYTPEALESIIVRRGRRIKALEQKMESERSRLESERSRLEMNIKEIYNSRSWRITGPVRYIGSLFKNRRSQI